MRWKLSILALFVGAIQAAAQTPAPSGVTPPAGTLVRAWRVDRSASPPSASGRLIALTADSVVLETARLGRPLALALDSVARLEFSAGRQRPTRKALVGATVGGIIGAGLGLAMGREIDNGDCHPPGCRRLKRLDVGLAAVMALPTGFLGGVIGAQFPGEHIWQPVQLDRRR